MSHSRVKPSNWAANEKLTSTQMNSLDTNVSNSVDKTSAGDTVSGPLTLSGAGRIVTNVVTGANADTTYQPNAQRVIRVTSAVASARTYTLGTTGVAAGDVIEIFADTTATQVVSVSDGSNIIWRIAKTGNLSTGCSSYAAFIYVGSAWRVFRTDRAPGLRYELFTSTTPTTWTCPPGVHSAQVTVCGGGGGGAGGMNGALDNTTYPKGGGGGGAAIPNTLALATTPGTAYNVAAGAGGTGGAAGSAGSDGSPSYFDTFYGRGAGGGAVSLETGAGSVASGGTPGKSGRLVSTSNSYLPPVGIGQGGYSASNTASSAVRLGAYGFQSDAVGGGTNGTDNGGGGGHKGGGAGAGGASGPRGAGGAGGNGGNGDVTLGTNGTNGSNAATASGAGGGGGGGGGCSATTAGTGGSGGNGGGGYVIVVWG